MRGDELRALAKRVEALTGPDREVDARICIALGLSKDNVMVGADGWCINSTTNPNPYRSPPYTASLDAAMTLVPERMFARLYCEAAQAIIVAWTDTVGWEEVARSDIVLDIPIALVAASLRARAQEADHGG